MTLCIEGIGVRDGLVFSYTIRTEAYARGMQMVTCDIQGLAYHTTSAAAAQTLGTVRRDLSNLLEDVHGMTGRALYARPIDQPGAVSELAPDHPVIMLYVPTQRSPAAYGTWLLRRLERGTAAGARTARRRSLRYSAVRLRPGCEGLWYLVDRAHPDDTATELRRILSERW